MILKCIGKKYKGSIMNTTYRRFLNIAAVDSNILSSDRFIATIHTHTHTHSYLHMVNTKLALPQEDKTLFRLQRVLFYNLVKLMYRMAFVWKISQASIKRNYLILN